jgi:hypothetical protein
VIELSFSLELVDTVEEWASQCSECSACALFLVPVIVSREEGDENDFYDPADER